jgi:hypothetical protein
MAQPISSTVEPTCEARARPSEGSFKSAFAAEVLPTDARGDEIKSIPTRSENEKDGGVVHHQVSELHMRRQPTPAVAQLCPIAPPIAPRIPAVIGSPTTGNRSLGNPELAEDPQLSLFAFPAALGILDGTGPSSGQGDGAIEDMRAQALLNSEFAAQRPSRVEPAAAENREPPMAPGIGGFNIDPPAPGANPIDGDVAIKNLQGRLLFKPGIGPETPIQTGRKARIARTGKSPFGIHLFAVIAVVGVMLLSFPDKAGKQQGDLTGVQMIPAQEGLAHAPRLARPARLAIESQKGFANEPLPLGVSLNDASGEDTITVAGLAEGTELSLGTSLGSAGWLVSASDLDKTFVGAPRDFVGVMEVTVSLRSAGDQLLDRQVIRFEWIEKNEARLTPPPDPPRLDPPNPDPPRVDLSKLDPPDLDPPRVDPSKLEPPNLDAARVDLSNLDPPNLDPAGLDLSKLDPPKLDPPKVDPSKADPPKADPPEPDPPRQAQAVRSLNPDEIATLIKVAKDFLQRGDIAAARVSLKRAALAGNAEAALELGMTFDEIFLAHRGAVGFVADSAQAREWYDRAIKLGSIEAVYHLARLASMPK